MSRPSPDVAEVTSSHRLCVLHAVFAVLYVVVAAVACNVLYVHVGQDNFPLVQSTIETPATFSPDSGPGVTARSAKELVAALAPVDQLAALGVTPAEQISDSSLLPTLRKTDVGVSGVARRDVFIFQLLARAYLLREGVYGRDVLENEAFFPVDGVLSEQASRVFGALRAYAVTAGHVPWLETSLLRDGAIDVSLWYALFWSAWNHGEINATRNAAWLGYQAQAVAAALAWRKPPASAAEFPPSGFTSGDAVASELAELRAAAAPPFYGVDAALMAFTSAGRLPFAGDAYTAPTPWCEWPTLVNFSLMPASPSRSGVAAACSRVDLLPASVLSAHGALPPAAMNLADAAELPSLRPLPREHHGSLSGGSGALGMALGTVFLAATSAIAEVAQVLWAYVAPGAHVRSVVRRGVNPVRWCAEAIYVAPASAAIAAQMAFVTDASLLFYVAFFASAAALTGGLYTEYVNRYPSAVAAGDIPRTDRLRRRRHRRRDASGLLAALALLAPAATLAAAHLWVAASTASDNDAANTPFSAVSPPLPGGAPICAARYVALIVQTVAPVAAFLLAWGSPRILRAGHFLDRALPRTAYAYDAASSSILFLRTAALTASVTWFLSEG